MTSLRKIHSKTAIVVDRTTLQNWVRTSARLAKFSHALDQVVTLLQLQRSRKSANTDRQMMALAHFMQSQVLPVSRKFADRQVNYHVYDVIDTLPKLARPFKLASSPLCFEFGAKFFA